MSIGKLFGRLRAGQGSVVQESGCHEPEYLTSLPTPTDGDYPLRKEQEEQLYQALRQRGRHILLHGPGGMGKTHMARKLFYRLRQDYKRLAWVEYGTDIRMSMTILQKNAASENPEVQFAQFVQKLEEAEQDTILFIDDVKEDAMDDVILSQITGMGITILMTSRCPSISPYETWELAPISSQDCAELFYANYEADPNRKYLRTVLAIAKRLERNVFAMLLLANVAGDASNLPRIARRMQNGSLMDHIGQLLEFSELTEEQQHVLQCLSLMNSGEMLESLVKWFDFQWSDVEILIIKGWLVRNKETECLVLHDLVREYYARHPANQRVLETFVKGALGETFNAGAMQNASADFKGKVLEFQVRAIAIMEKGWKSKKDLACAYNRVGISFGDFGNRRKALEYVLRTLAIREEVLPSDDPDLVTSYNNVGAAYADLGEYRKALEYMMKALEIREKIFDADSPLLALSYNNVGTTYGDLGDQHKALEYVMMALKIREKVLPADHPDLATSYNNVGAAYADLGEYHKALEYALRALEIRDKILAEDHPSIAVSCDNVGSFYGELGDHHKALEYKQRALAIREKILPLDHPDLAISYNNVGCSHGELGDQDNQMKYLQKALVIREKVLPAYHPQIATSCNNIAWAYIEAGQYQIALEWMRRALDIAQRSLPEEHPERKRYEKTIESLETKIEI